MRHDFVFDAALELVTMKAVREVPVGFRTGCAAAAS